MELGRRRELGKGALIMASFRKRGAVWYYRIYDENGKQVDRKGFRDKRETERAAAIAEEQIRQSRLGLIDRAAGELRRQGSRPLSEQIEEWRQHQEAAGVSERQLYQSLLRVRRICELSGATCARDLDLASIQLALGKARTKFRNKQGQPLGPQTLNHHLAAMRTFCNWMVAAKRLPSNPADDVSEYTIGKDLRWRRRVLTPDEFTKLVETARSSDESIRLMNGTERAWLYLLAATTGLRREEIASLTRDSFDWRAGEIRVPGSETKNGEEAVQPIHASLLADGLR